jgi:hypothetical protein
VISLAPAHDWGANELLAVTALECLVGIVSRFAQRFFGEAGTAAGRSPGGTLSRAIDFVVEVVEFVFVVVVFVVHVIIP